MHLDLWFALLVFWYSIGTAAVAVTATTATTATATVRSEMPESRFDPIGCVGTDPWLLIHNASAIAPPTPDFPSASLRSILHSWNPPLEKGPIANICFLPTIVLLNRFLRSNLFSTSAAMPQPRT